LARARETAEIIGAALNVTVESDPVWMERNVGEIGGLTAAQVRDRFPQPVFTSPFDTIGGSGEGDWELFLRAGQALYNLLKRPVGNYLVVSHGGILNLTMHAVVGITPHANFAGPRFRFGNTGFARLVYHPKQHRWSIDTLNDRSHWPEAVDQGLIN
jgi:probable phosphoglycerate mutase